MTPNLRIAIPTEGDGGLDARRSAHFGHADSFTVVDIVDGLIASTRTVLNPPHAHGGCGSTVAMLASEGVGVAIVVGMGGGPLGAMNSIGMTPFFDDRSITPGEAVKAFLAGTTERFAPGQTCAGH